jgi:two-component system sensor histidine kinase VicK
VGRGVHFMHNVKDKMDIFFDKNAPSIVVEIDEYREGYKSIRKRGGKIRAFTEITKENVFYCKDLSKLVDELRHLDGVRGGIAVSETEYMATTVLQESTPLTQVIYSNVKEVVEHGQYIFDTLWSTAIPAEHKIREIEEGVVHEIIESISDPTKLQNKVVDLLRTAREEILVVFSSANAFHRQERTGSIQILKDLIISYPEIKIKILTPMDNEIQRVCKDLSKFMNFQYRFMEPLSKVSIMVVDKKFSIVAELKDDTKKTIAESIGLGTYSNSGPTVLTYTAIFDIIWKQTELYEQLQVHDKMQKEFINTAAHELRTPIQPIISLSSFVKSRIKDDELSEFLDVISRNANRLKKLSEDILDITKIESNSFPITKERFAVKEVVSDIICNYHDNTNSNNGVKISYDVPDSLVIYGDKSRISQVISNLINNSIKFSSGAVSISIIAESKLLYVHNEGNREMAVIRVKDTGIGINHEIFEKLFTKFTTTSFQGIGLGLYISKKIIEAHKGKIWAENNEDGGGATFSFSLPIHNDSENLHTYNRMSDHANSIKL